MVAPTCRDVLCVVGVGSHCCYWAYRDYPRDVAGFGNTDAADAGVDCQLIKAYPTAVSGMRTASLVNLAPLLLLWPFTLAA